MATKNFKKRLSGSHEPKFLGAIFDEKLRSNPRLANAYHKFKEALAEDAEVETEQLYRNFYPNTELGIDLKLFTRKPGRMHVGNSIICTLTRDGEDHFEAVEDALKKQVAERRNPIIFKGMRINVHSRADGTLYPTFNRPHYTKRFTFSDFCRKAAEELMAVAEAFERTWK